MEYLKSNTYYEDIETAIRYTIGFRFFFKKKVLVLGASGLIGSFITDCFLYANKSLGAEITIYAASRDIEQLRKRFGDNVEGDLYLIQVDVTTINLEETFDYIIHAAGYGHPGAFREMPAEVLLSNVVGTWKV